MAPAACNDAEVAVAETNDAENQSDNEVEAVRNDAEVAVAKTETHDPESQSDNEIEDAQRTLKNGPASLIDLYNYSWRYATTLLGSDENCEPATLNYDACESARRVLECRVVLHDQYSGMGTAGWTLHRCLKDLRMALEKLTCHLAKSATAAVSSCSDLSFRVTVYVRYCSYTGPARLDPELPILPNSNKGAACSGCSGWRLRLGLGLRREQTGRCLVFRSRCRCFYVFA